MLTEIKVFFETSFDSKQPKLEPKIVSAQSEKKTFVSVVSLLYQNNEFWFSIEPKQTEDQPKQFDREHI
jgi:hypothetical protein